MPSRGLLRRKTRILVTHGVGYLPEVDRIVVMREGRVSEQGTYREPWLPDGYSQIFRSYVFGPPGFWTMAPLRYAAKFDPFLSLDCARTPSTLAQSKETKGSNLAA